MNHAIQEIYIPHQFDQFSKIVNKIIFVCKLIWCECLSNYRAIFICKIADENEMKILCEPPLIKTKCIQYKILYIHM